MDLLNIKPNQISESVQDKIFLFYGEGGTRKTSVAAKFPNHLIGAFEIGYKYIDGAVAEPLHNWPSFKKFVRSLDNTKVKEKYQTVAIDTVTLAYSACYEHVLKQHGVEDPGDLGFGKGWRLIRKEFEKTILKIPQMGYGLVLIAHSDDVPEEKGDTFKTKVDIDKRPAAIIKGLADFIFYLKSGYREGKEKIAENETVYAFTKLVDIETKTRLNHLAPVFEFTYDNLTEEIKKAIDKKKLQEGITTKKEGDNLYKQEEQPFEELKEETIALAKELAGKDEQTQDKVKDLIIEILNGSITKVTKVNRGRLVGLKDKLEDLKEDLDG